MKQTNKRKKKNSLIGTSKTGKLKIGSFFAVKIKKKLHDETGGVN